MEPQVFHLAWPIPVTCGPVSSPGWRRISPWGAEVPKSPLSSVKRELSQSGGSRPRSTWGSASLLTLHLPCLVPLHLLFPRLGAATGCCHWVHANSKYPQHRVSSSSQGAVLAPPQDSGPPTSHLQEHGMGHGITGLERKGILVGSE